ncbi:MAG: rhodanese-related sulfurtransferase [Paraglaciecola sp.]|jgi:rhodanese-related sulfurtransferase
MKVTQPGFTVSVKIEQALNKMLQGSVAVISCDMLADSISAGSAWLILDSREADEFEISHLPAAKWVGYSDFCMHHVSEVPKNANVVVYCSIGVRSEKIAKKLIASGFSNVRNLYGGIFAWANDYKPLVKQNQVPTLAVHGYDHRWAKLLDQHVHCVHTK